MSPMVVTVAPTIPVEAARSAPTITTEMASPPGKRPEELCHGFQEVLGQSRALQGYSHEYKERHSDKSEISHDSPYSEREKIEKTHAEAVESKGKCGPTNGEGDGITRQD